MYSSSYVWAKVLNYLEQRLNAPVVSAWFDDAEVVELTDDEMILHTSTAYRKGMIETRCLAHIQDAMKEIFNSDVRITVYDDNQLREFKSKSEQRNSMDFNPQFTFDSFVVGPSNRFAHGAARAVASTPGQVYNPLFIYGPSGLGKTHLLYAIANELRRHNPNLKVVYIKGDQFTNELIDALKAGKNVEFRNKYRGADLFLVDDIQFIAGKDSTQEEFFHTFNTLYEDHKQIVLTSDRKPDEMATLEDRLRTRFQWGLIADIKPPDYETRMAIIKNKAISLNLDLPNDVCSYIANNITNNVRQIEGTIKKILAYYNLNNMPLDLPNVSRAIDDMFKVEGNAVPTPNLIINQVSKFYSIDETVLRGTLKNKGTAEARQVAMYLIRTMTNLSLPEIGREFGRDHSTVIHSIKKVELSMKDSNSPVACNVRDITSNINSSL